jgi:hypothetical protein
MYRKHGHEEQDMQEPTSIQDREALSDDCNLSSRWRTPMHRVDVEFPFEAQDSTSSQRGSPSFMANKRQRWREDMVEDENDRMVVEPSYPSGSGNSCVKSNIPTLDPDQVLVQMIQQFANSHTEQSGISRSGYGLSYSQVVKFCRSSGIPLSRMLRLDLLGLCHPPASAADAVNAKASATNDPSCNS